MGASSYSLPDHSARKTVSTVVEKAFSIVSGPTNKWALDFVLDTNSAATAAILTNPAAVSGAVTTTCSIDRAMPGTSVYSQSTTFDLLIVPAFSVGPLVVGSVVRRLNSALPCRQCSRNNTSETNDARPCGELVANESAQAHFQAENRPARIRYPGPEVDVKPSTLCQGFSCENCSRTAFSIGRFVSSFCQPLPSYFTLTVGTPYILQAYLLEQSAHICWNFSFPYPSLAISKNFPQICET